MRLPESERAMTGPPCDALSIHSFLATLLKVGGTHAVLELTSHAIRDDRIFGLQFSALAFTNGGSEAHVDANHRLFTDPALHRSQATLCAFNNDDEAARELARSSLGDVVTFGLADATYSCDRTGISVRINGHDIRLPLIGRHNVTNVLAAASVISHIVRSPDAVLQLETVRPLPGRLERLPSPLDVDVYLDQAYLPANMALSLGAVREFAGARRVVCVAGASGGDDKRQRPARARAAANGSDLCILTCDDPRGEHPGSIVTDMLKGVPPAAQGRLKTILDRGTAIETAIHEALPDGIVVILGKRVMKDERRDGDRQLAFEVLLDIR
jgi:UDP-N-acetylmuramoyl-L-alanyl-D-glutamate--2,6-diaminopimelate ligase